MHSHLEILSNSSFSGEQRIKKLTLEIRPDKKLKECRKMFRKKKRILERMLDYFISKLCNKIHKLFAYTFTNYYNSVYCLVTTALQDLRYDAREAHAHKNATQTSPINNRLSAADYSGFYTQIRDQENK